MANMGQQKRELQEKAREAEAHAKTPFDRMQAKILKRGPAGIKGVGRRFKIFDDDGNRQLSFSEFSKGMHDMGLSLNQTEMTELFNDFDRDHQGTIDFDEFLRAMQPPMNNGRKALVEKAFSVMDKTGDGVITYEDLVGKYDHTKHPKFLNGEMTKKQVFEEYLKTFEPEGDLDGTITLEEFTAYYASISASIDNDAYFRLMMWNSFKVEV